MGLRFAGPSWANRRAWMGDARRPLLIALSCVLLLASCVPQGGPVSDVGVDPSGSDADQLRTTKRMSIAIVGNVTTLVDRFNAGGVGVPGGGELELLVSPGLGITNDKGALQPVLAEAVPTIENGLWIVLPDGRMETTWKLRPGTIWHDGTPVTAGDAVFSATVEQDRDIPMRRNAAYSFVESVDAPDPGTLTVGWKRTYIQADQLFKTPLLPRHLVERPYLDTGADFVQSPYFSDAFVGNGPYRVKEFAVGSHVLLQRNNEYVLGQPKIDEIEVRFIPDPNTLLANVLAGEVDLTLGRGLSLEQAIQTRDQWRDGKIDVAFTSWIVIYPQFLNPTPSIVTELQFRRALMHAIDRQQMADSLQGELVSVAHTFLHPNEPEYRDVESGIVRYDYDPRMATQLIEELGYVRGTDGAFRDAGGQRLSVELRTSPEQDIQQKSVLSVADQWQRAGIGVEPVVMAAQRTREREYVQTFPSFMLYRQPNDPNLLLVRLTSDQTPLPENDFVGRNHPRYRNPEFDTLIDRYFTTIARPDRTQVLGQIVQHTTDRLTLMGLFYDTEPILIGNRLGNVTAAKASASTPVWNVLDWDVQ
ncbi:MAG: hypothetical protein GEU73_11465 [Chloroflexi bacterium]|nr:hypothetical protein [Chloroflexota bacterium]